MNSSRTISAIAAATLILAVCAPIAHAAAMYSQDFTLTDPFGMNPFRVENAFLRTEPFGTPVRYWQPSTPGVWSEVVYKFDVGFAIETASMFMSVTAYTIGSDANIDNGAESYVDVSIDDVTYTNVLAAYANHIDYAGPGDISALVAGSDVIYVRGRQFMTVNYSGFNGSQFLRGDPGATFNVSATGVPEPTTTMLLVGGAMGLFSRRSKSARPS
jgi:hypothetical protein